MKIRLRRSNTVEDFQDNKRRRLFIKLTSKSDKSRKLQVKLSREQQVAEINRLPEVVEKSLDLNKSGDKRGLHMREEDSTDASERMKKVRAMRRFYNKQMPVQQCNGCAYSAQCPQYKAGYECAFLPYMTVHKIESVDDLIFYMKELVGSNMQRIHWGLTAERLSGGAPSLENSEALSMAFTQLKELHQIATKSDESIEIETDDTSIIGQIFGGLKNLVNDTKQANAKPIEVAPVERKLSVREDVLALTDSEDHPADVNLDLLHEYSRDQLLSRTKKSSLAGGLIEVSTVK